MAASLLAAMVVQVWTTPHRMWDLQVYRHAVVMHEEGLDPYDADLLRSRMGKDLPFVYPPYMLWLWRPLAWVDALWLDALWLAGKIGALLGLWAIWSRLWPREIGVKCLEKQINRCNSTSGGSSALPVGGENPGISEAPNGWGWAFPLFALWAFDGAIFRDLRSGNIGLFEQILLWGGILAFREGRVGWAISALTLASLAKPYLVLMSLGVMGLGFVLGEPYRARAWRVMVGVGISLGLFWTFSLGLDGETWMDFFAAERGVAGHRDRATAWLLADLWAGSAADTWMTDTGVRVVLSALALMMAVAAVAWARASASNC